MAALRDPKLVEAAVSKARVFVVGAGGIGCELLKDLVLSGFRHIEVIDLDTIDLSNLNRQFLFRKEHIGLSKAKVAADAVRKFVYTPCNPNAALDPLEIIAHHASVKESTFGPEFIKTFDVVVNALDNLDARRHVNRVCLTAGVPLVDSATEGYMGYVQPIFGRTTECFECQPKAAPKTFATCTIRSHPTEIIHCITWAKMLFERLWGVKDHTNAVSEVSCDLSAADTFNHVFSKDIAALASMENLWTSRKPPTPLSYEDALSAETDEDRSYDVSTVEADHAIWSLPVCVRTFTRAYEALVKKWEEGGKVSISWDKDEPFAMDFVAAAANIRAHIFGITEACRFDVKSKAGNIIPAIATSNAIIAGFAVSEIIKIVMKETSYCRGIHLSTNPSRLFVVRILDQPNPHCYVCGHHLVCVKTDTTRTTLKQFITLLLRKSMGFNDPSITVDSDIVYESGEGLEPIEIATYEANAAKTLAALHVTNDSTVEVSDFSQNLTVSILVSHMPYTEPEPDSKKSEEELLFTIVSGSDATQKH